eukprot:Gregarina_sp_Poly_1__9227@NODE_569_length_7491_cov_137_215517_g446_i0_p7_GENE_NODE_569_length_7491_cov_137_215517_g446_i0NODE_569_length_7491_cov_137_215517_g446_i0_p7_ORF_typecomplete_len109_score4_20DUF2600/PF10776_9/0_045_NODE_569_length_7491_cov_137_215517_g446_i029523278
MPSKSIIQSILEPCEDCLGLIEARNSPNLGELTRRGILSTFAMLSVTIHVDAMMTESYKYSLARIRFKKLMRWVSRHIQQVKRVTNAESTVSTGSQSDSKTVYQGTEN